MKAYLPYYYYALFTEVLTGIKLDAFEQNINSRCNELKKYLEAVSDRRYEIMGTESSFKMLGDYFKEPTESIIVSEAELGSLVLPKTPVMISVGEGNDARYIISVDGTVIREVTDLTDAVKAMFITYLNFDIKYDPKLTNSFEFFQRFMVKYHDDRTKTPGKVMRLAKALANHI
ncbi:uncharacterized protein LOC141909366 [Tubulanus polymorphus]|uniref:uncharacterized protein LOC141909366 n=1 Tax=Tubulanus polymorphus TaxID=672921 RepID=UPI003DA1ED58